ncbi:helix-turn-helix domain-containing protein [Streptomyces boncukensis]|uniref:Helix-turn-helix domain-containing protein n=1 Tax=Streptomyces boncukensis TaxID=2711219 RepID=A0A6G4WSE0_9ACTN|nr:helix-turn-helix transcriptional regulator [Streptomyces boncukensis]NGO67762.1 helix-turn-helix domain-containing protein [Streptomyces boncukensis]
MAAEKEVGANVRGNPHVSTLAYFGTELRIKREEAGLSQSMLATRTFCTHSLVSRIESAQRVPTEEFTQRCDEVLGTGGLFLRMWPVIIQHAYPDWFRPFVGLEKDATEVWDFENQVVPGLLQTEEYARALFAAARLPNTDELVAARMTRQDILGRDDRARLWVVLDENVLRRAVGGPTLMARQLREIVRAAEDQRTIVQVIPYEVGAHASMDGPFVGLTLDEGPDVVCTEGRIRGTIIAASTDVAEYSHTYDLLRADALSPRASLDMIAARAKELSS